MITTISILIIIVALGTVIVAFNSHDTVKIVNTYVFYVENENIVKVGFSDNVERRKKELERKYNIDIVILKIYPINIEKLLHNLLKTDYLENGIITNDWLGLEFKYGTEWFKFSDKIKKMIK
jgi:hypothetical protein